jgi:hypothetical protein
MLALRCATLLLMTAPLLACGEENPNPLVNDDVSWQLGCGESAGDTCASFGAHTQNDERVKDDFVVSCTKGSSGLNVTITDPGDRAANRARSVFKVERLNAKAGSCTVTVTDSLMIDDFPITFRGQCGDGDCEIQGSDSGDWDFDGTIFCKSLTNDGEDAHTLSKGGTTQPMVLKIDNCD